MTIATYKYYLNSEILGNKMLKDKSARSKQSQNVLDGSIDSDPSLERIVKASTRLVELRKISDEGTCKKEAVLLLSEFEKGIKESTKTWGRMNSGHINDHVEAAEVAIRAGRVDMARGHLVEAKMLIRKTSSIFKEKNEAMLRQIGIVEEFLDIGRVDSAISAVEVAEHIEG